MKPSSISTPFFLRPQSSPILWGLILLGAAISVSLTIQMSVAVSGRGFAPIPVAIGIFAEALKYLTIPLGLWFLRTERGRGWFFGLGLLSVAACLMAGSVSASMGYLAHSDGLQRLESWKRSPGYLAIHEQLSVLQGQTEALRTTAARYRDYGRITVSRNDDEAAAVLDAKRVQILNELADREAAIKGPGDFFGSLATVLSSGSQADDLRRDPAKALRSLVFFAIAIVLELGVAIAIQVLQLQGAGSAIAENDGKPARGRVRAKEKKEVPELMMAPHVVHRDVQEPHSEVRDLDHLCGDAYAKARDAVVQGRVRPAYRSLRDALGVRQQTVAAIFRRLESEGVLTRNGNRFVVAEAR